MPHPTIDQTIGNTPLVRLQRLSGPENARRGNVILGKLEGNNPGGSVKDRPALSMITRAEERGEIRAGRPAGRSDQWQYRHRAGNDRGDEGLSHDADHAGQPQRREARKHGGVSAPS